MMLKKKQLTILFWLLLFSVPSFTQIQHTGIPFIRNYERDEYQAGRQNWDFAQDQYNVIYFANNDGILEFDGSHWELFPIGNRSVVRSVAVDDSGRVYAGAYNEFGYLKTLDNGKKVYHSLTDKIPKDKQDFGEVWKILVTENGVIFQSFSALYFYKDGDINVLDYGKNYHFAFYRGGNLYITEWERGLLRYNGQEFEPVPGGSYFSGERKIWTMMQLSGGRFLLGTQNEGLFVYQDDTVRAWNNEANRFLKQNQLFSACRISENYYVFGSIQNGIILVNGQGDILQHLNKERGLQNNTILLASRDQGGNLWLGLDNGIDYLEIQSPISYLGEAFNIDGTGYTSALYQGDLYLGTNQGLFYHPQAYDNGRLDVGPGFQIVDDTKGQVWSLDTLDGRLFCGHNKGSFVINKGSSRQITNIQGGWNFLGVPGHPGHIIQGAYNGLLLLEKQNGTWQFERRIKGFQESSRIETWDANGNLWITHGYKGIYRLQLNENLDSVVQVSLYNQKDGLPSNTGNSVFKHNNNIYASTDQGIYRYVFLADQFEKDTLFKEAIGSDQVSPLHRDRYGDLWYFKDYSRKIEMIPSDSSPDVFEDVDVLDKLDDQFVAAFEHVNVIDSNNIVIGTIGGFAHYDPFISPTDSERFRSIIRESSFYGNNDTLQWFNLMRINDKRKEIGINTLKSIKFRFASTFYEDLKHTTYSYLLKGFDQKWSEWSARNTKEYTNLPPGDYTFQVKAKNVYGRISETSRFRFTILPPWYQTTWAYIAYALLTIGFILAASHYLNLKLEKEKLKIEQQNKEELRRQREEYEREQLAMKNKIMQLENEKLQSDIAQEEADVKLKNKELSAQALHINKKNEILNYLKKELDKVINSVNPDAQFKLKMLNKKIDQDLNPEEDWKKFEQYFDEVQGDFIARLKEKYPELSPKDLKLCAYLRMNLSSKEIASLLNITPRGVEIHRYRLRKKLDLTREVNLVEFLMDL